MKSILSYNNNELINEIRSISNNNGNIPEYRANQILEWVYVKRINDFNEMTNIPKNLRNILIDNFVIHPIELIKTKESNNKEAVKYLFKTHDGYFIEAVKIIHPNRNTLCISSMVGCPLGCKFCATSYLENRRNLYSSEILSQILLLYREDKIDNIVFMGMGEPLLNENNVFKSITLLSDKKLLNFSSRRITISTAGIIKGIEKLTKSNLKSHLAVSLNSPFQSEREKIMPVTKTNHLDNLYKVLKKYNEKIGRFTFEYIIIPEVNTGKEHAKEIIKLRKKLNFNLNLIKYNRIKKSTFKSASPKDVHNFKSYFKNTKLEVVERLSKGDDIAAGCGQLAGTQN